MARFLLTPWPLLGHINPTLAIGHALRDRGHEVNFYTGESARAIVEAEGFTCFPFRRVDEKLVHAAEHPLAYSRSVWDQIRAVRQIKTGLRQWLVETIPDQVEDLQEVLAARPVDVLVTETGMWGPTLVLAETERIPVVVFSTFASCLLPGPDAPAWGRGLPRPRTPLMRWRSSAQRKVMWWLSSDFRAAANAVRQRYGLPSIDITVTELAGKMPLYLMPSVPEFDYQRGDLPPSVHYVGPCTWDKPHNQPAPAWLTALPETKPVVHVTEATIHSHEPLLLKAAVQGLADLPLQVVMTIGRHRQLSELDLGPIAPNIRVEEYVPHSDLIPKTSVMVCLGGAGTVFAALKAGVPLVVVPTEWDKPENAQRVVEAGVGVRIEPSRLTPERLRAAVQRVLSETSFRENARRLADACARHDGASEAARLLVELASEQTQTENTGIELAEAQFDRHPVTQRQEQGR